MPKDHSTEVDVDSLFALADQAADAAGEILMRHFGRAKISFKGAVDLVTNADKESEAQIVALIRQAYPGHGIVAEEGGGVETDHDVRWIIDPIDGTTNYAHGFPMFAVSIGVEARGKVVVGIVYNPASGEKYTAIRGRGAALNGRPLKVSAVDTLDRALVATGFPYTVRETKYNNMDHFENFIYAAQGLRRLGSAALDLAYVARGSVEGYWEPNINAWDVAAGMLLVEEAGGKVTDLRGEAFTYAAGNILASNGLVHDEMCAVIKKGVARP